MKKTVFLTATKKATGTKLFKSQYLKIKNYFFSYMNRAYVTCLHGSLSCLNQKYVLCGTCLFDKQKLAFTCNIMFKSWLV